MKNYVIYIIVKIYSNYIKIWRNNKIEYKSIRYSHKHTILIFLTRDRKYDKYR
jgi:hypothetical protein